MGFFFDRLVLQEVEINGQELQDNDVQTADYTDGGGNQSPADNNPTEPPADQQSQYSNPQDDQQAINNNQDALPQDADDDMQPTDYTQDVGFDNQDGRNLAPTPTPDNEEQPVDDIKKQEEEMLKNLTPEQLNIKHRELKNNFLAMYEMVDNIIGRIVDAGIDDENRKVIEFVSNQLANLKDMLVDYINSIYKTKSYIENMINYNRFLVVLNGISKLIEEMNEKED